MIGGTKDISKASTAVGKKPILIHLRNLCRHPSCIPVWSTLHQLQRLKVHGLWSPLVKWCHSLSSSSLQIHIRESVLSLWTKLVSSDSFRCQHQKGDRSQICCFLDFFQDWNWIWAQIVFLMFWFPHEWFSAWHCPKTEVEIWCYFLGSEPCMAAHNNTKHSLWRQVAFITFLQRTIAALQDLPQAFFPSIVNQSSCAWRANMQKDVTHI